MRSKLKEKKILIIAVITTIFIISAGLIYYFYFYKEKEGSLIYKAPSLSYPIVLSYIVNPIEE